MIIICKQCARPGAPWTTYSFKCCINSYIKYFFTAHLRHKTWKRETISWDEDSNGLFSLGWVIKREGVMALGKYLNFYFHVPVCFFLTVYFKNKNRRCWFQTLFKAKVLRGSRGNITKYIAGVYLWWIPRSGRFKATSPSGVIYEKVNAMDCGARGQSEASVHGL